MNEKITDRLMGAEIEYYGSRDDKSFQYVDEYYAGMREVNSILLPGTDTLVALQLLKEVMLKMSTKIRFPLGTRGWGNSYGFAFNGVHLHLSGKIDKDILSKNIFRLMNKHGLSPRTVSSWHIFSRITEYSFKSKRKHCPIYSTPRNTTEIRVLDLEYFLDDDIIADLAIAIDGSYNGTLVPGDDSWVKRLQAINIDDYKGCCKFLDDNLASNWVKRDEGFYVNTVGDYEVNFRDLPDWTRFDRVEEPEELEVCEPITSSDSEVRIPQFDARIFREISRVGRSSERGENMDYTEAVNEWTSLHLGDSNE